MGYTTQFQGVLKFTRELAASELAYLNKSICGEDAREHPEWNEPDLCYMDVALTDDFQGLEWDGSEKTYHMERIVALVIRLMNEKYGKIMDEFGLEGELLAQGEDIEDRWRLVVNGTDVRRVEWPPDGQRVECPDCGATFYVNEPEETE